MGCTVFTEPQCLYKSALIDIHVNLLFSCQFLMKPEFSRQFFENLLSDFMNIPQWEPSCSMLTNGQGYMTALKVAFHNFAKASKISTFCTPSLLMPSVSVCKKHALFFPKIEH
jgi:hypothetical protein